MRVTFVIPYFYPAMGYGGVPRLAYEMARGLVRRGHDVSVMTTDSAGEMRIPAETISSVQNDGINGIHVRYYRNLSNGMAYNHRIFVPARFFFDVRRRLSHSDIVHIHDLRSFLSVASHSALRALRQPYVLSPHGGLRHLGKKYAKVLFDFLWGRAILRDAAAICAVSPSEEQDAAMFGIEPHRICRLPGSIDADYFRELPPRGQFASQWHLGGRRIVLFLGRLNWIKGIDVLIESMSLLKDFSNVHLVIAGPDDGAERNLRSLVKEKKLDDQVTFTGFLNDVQKAQALVDSELVVVPSRSEGFSLSMLEGLACGKPVIVSSACIEGRWIQKDGVSFTFRSGDSADLAQKLQAILCTGVHRSMLERERNFVLEEFSTDALAAKAETLYKSILSARSHAFSGNS